MKKIFLLVTLLISQISFAQNDDAIAAALQLAAWSILSSPVAPKIPEDQIRGECEYNKGFCPGAQLVLKNESEKEVGRQTISTREGFVFPNLKPGTYSLELSYPRYKFAAVTRKVTTGTALKIELKEK